MVNMFITETSQSGGVSLVCACVFVLETGTALGLRRSLAKPEKLTHCKMHSPSLNVEDMVQHWFPHSIVYSNVFANESIKV